MFRAALYATLSGMQTDRLLPKAWVVIVLSALYTAAEALCSVFVSVYLWINSLSFITICWYHLTLYAVTPIVFLLSGWYAQVRDRVYVYRLGLVLHAVFYAVLLALRERSPDYVIPLGALLGVAWGVYWAGANPLSFDVTAEGKREYYFGLTMGVTGAVGLAAPVVSGLIIRFSGEAQQGYLIIFGFTLVLYVASLALTFEIPRDNTRRPYRLRRALFPGKDQRDWQLVMLISASLSGSFNIIPFVLALLMYMQTSSELSVGGYASFQALAGVIVAFAIGRLVAPRNRRFFMRWGVGTLTFAGLVMLAFPVSVATLFVFGLLRSVSGPLWGIPHSGLRLDIISRCAEEPAQRIEYLCAWEVPLAIGRVMMMVTMMSVYGLIMHSELGLRIVIFLMCAVRIISYQLAIRTSPIRSCASEKTSPGSATH